MNALTPAGAALASTSLAMVSQPAAGSPRHPDTLLSNAVITLLADQWHHLDRQWGELAEQNGGTPSDPRLDALAGQMSSICDRIREIGCRSREDMRAVASILATGSELMDPEDEDKGSFEKLMPALVRAAASEAGLDQASDATLLAACAEFDVAERQFLSVFDTAERSTAVEDAAGYAATEKQRPLLQQIEANPPTTLAGYVAVARSLELWDRELLKVSAGSDETGEVLTATLVRGLLQAPRHEIDASLIALCDEFLAVRADREDKAEGANAITDDDAFEVVNNAAAERMDGLVRRMEAVPPTTEVGVQTVLRCLAEEFGEMAIAFDEPDTTPHQLLKLVLQGALRLGAPVVPSPDAELLALRPEYDRIMATYEAANGDDIDWSQVEDSGAELDALCDRIAGLPAAVTREGRALQAICALRQFTYMADWNDGEEPTGAAGVVYNVLVRQIDGLYPLPGMGAVEKPEATDAALLALKPQFDELQAELRAALEKNPARGGKKATRRKFDELIAQAKAMPQARTAEGREFQGRVEWLAQARGVEIIRGTQS